ncbi:MAG: DUF5606 domain-containing protein [Bacteroidaceae bacterium]|nr:DUF5606 domain-containing protein [Bacteroidaceae bacterium]
MLKTILAIAGKPGLYKLLSRGANSLIVETVDAQKKRMPAFGADKVVSLGDISIYTDDDKEIALSKVFENMKDLYEGKIIDIVPKKAGQDEIIAVFEKALPNYDKDRVRVSDMRKVISWYNLLIDYGFTTFFEEEEATKKEESAESIVSKKDTTQTRNASKAPVQKNTAKRAATSKARTAVKSTVKKTGNSSK